jgi:hypothetical protein
MVLCTTCQRQKNLEQFSFVIFDSFQIFCTPAKNLLKKFTIIKMLYCYFKFVIVMTALVAQRLSNDQDSNLSKKFDQFLAHRHF